VRKSRGCRFKSDHYLVGSCSSIGRDHFKDVDVDELIVDVDVDELISSNVDSIPLMYPLSYTYYSV